MKIKYLWILLLVVAGIGGRERYNYQYANSNLIAHYKMDESTASDGDELVTNGDFANWTDDDPDGWTLDAESGAGAYGTRDPEVSQVATGQSHANAGGETGGFCNIYQTASKSIIVSQTLTLVVGERYRLSIKVNKVTTGQIVVHNIGTQQWTDTVIDAAGTTTVFFTCTTASTPLLIEDYAVNIDVTIEEVSMKLCAAEDSSDNDYNGSLQEDTADAHAAGVVNGAFDFDGTTDYIHIGNTAEDIKSVAMWINPDDITGIDIIINLDDTSYLAGIVGTVTKFGFATGTQTIYVDGVVGTAITPNWHFVVLTSSVAVTASNLKICEYDSTLFNGLIDDVMLFDVELSRGAVKQLYNRGKYRERY